MSPAAGRLSSPSPLRMTAAPAPMSAEGGTGEDAETDAETDTEVESSKAAVPDLTGMTKAQLLTMAAELGIEGVSSRNTKAEIVAAIEAAER